MQFLKRQEEYLNLLLSKIKEEMLLMIIAPMFGCIFETIWNLFREITLNLWERLSNELRRLKFKSKKLKSKYRHKIMLSFFVIFFLLVFKQFVSASAGDVVDCFIHSVNIVTSAG